MSRHHRSRHQRHNAQHSFTDAPNVTEKRSSFNRSHGLKTTFNSGMLIPFFLDEVLPGDTFNLQTTAFVRMATPIFPVMDNIRIHFYYFFVPNRLTWSNWPKFCGEQDNPGDSTDFTIPSFTEFVPGVGSIFDYYGYPVAYPLGAQNEHVTALPLRGYNRIYNDWFRPEDIQDSLKENVDDGPDEASDYELERVMKAHDYFTSCLPWPQKGNAVPLPGLGTQSVTTLTDLSRHPDFWFRTNTGPGGHLMVEGASEQSQGDKIFDSLGQSSDQPVPLMHDATTDGLYATSISTVDPQITATVNELRLAFQTQKMLERDARSGTRYIEILKSHFGVTSPDSRLQRTEYLGGSIGYINFSAVPQTSATEQGVSPQGNLGAFATAQSHGGGFRQSFVEHGFVHGFLAVRCDLTYQSGLSRMLTRKTRLDHYWPVFADIGEQPVLNKEIYYSHDIAANNLVFGYQEAFADYRYKPSQITGKFRSQAPHSLDSWHLAQAFTSTPSLGLAFLQENAPVDRVVAVTTEPQFLGDFYFNYICSRPMPTYSIPGLIDHF